MDSMVIYNISIGKINLGVDKSIILKFILEKYFGKCTVPINLRIGYRVGFCGDGRLVRNP
jgi:hypothetical protein